MRRLALVPVALMLACAPGQPPEGREEVAMRTRPEPSRPSPETPPVERPPAPPVLDEAAIVGSACRLVVNTAPAGTELHSFDIRIHPQGTAQRTLDGVTLLDGEGLELVRMLEMAPVDNEFTVFDELRGYRPDDTQRTWLSLAKGPRGSEAREVSRELEVVGAFGAHLSVLEVDAVMMDLRDETTTRTHLLVDAAPFDASTLLEDTHAALAGRVLETSLALDESDEMAEWSRKPRAPRKASQLAGLGLELRLGALGDADVPQWAELVQPKPRQTAWGLYGVVAIPGTMKAEVAREDGELRSHFVLEFPLLPLPEALAPHVPVQGVLRAPNGCGAIDLETGEILAPTPDGWRRVGRLERPGLEQSNPQIVGATFIRAETRFAQGIELDANAPAVYRAPEEGACAYDPQRLPDHAAALKWTLPEQGFGIAFP